MLTWVQVSKIRPMLDSDLWARSHLDALALDCWAHTQPLPATAGALRAMLRRLGGLPPWAHSSVSQLILATAKYDADTPATFFHLQRSPNFMLSLQTVANKLTDSIFKENYTQQHRCVCNFRTNACFGNEFQLM